MLQKSFHLSRTAAPTRSSERPSSLAAVPRFLGDRLATSLPPDLRIPAAFPGWSSRLQPLHARGAQRAGFDSPRAAQPRSGIRAPLPGVKPGHERIDKSAVNPSRANSFLVLSEVSSRSVVFWPQAFSRRDYRDTTTAGALQVAGRAGSVSTPLAGRHQRKILFGFPGRLGDALPARWPGASITPAPVARGQHLWPDLGCAWLSTPSTSRLLVAGGGFDPPTFGV